MADGIGDNILAVFLDCDGYVVKIRCSDISCPPKYGLIHNNSDLSVACCISFRYIVGSFM